ncbi:MAG: asparagine synthetase A [Candidatus Njordarchaeum guaymaensis]
MEWSTKTQEYIVPELRIYKRHLFLKLPKYRYIFKIQSTILKAARDYLYSHGFIELVAPVIAPVTDPGVREAREFDLEYYEERAVLVTSAILYKLAGLKIHDKIFYLAHNIRREPINLRDFTTRLAEFRQIDIEIANIDRNELVSISEDFLIYIIKAVKKERREELEKLGRDLRVPRKPFKRIKFDDAVEIVSEKGYGLDSSGELSKDAERYISMLYKEPFWIIDFPAKIRGFYYKKKDQKYLLDMDLMYPEGFGEGASGGEREIDPIKVRERMMETGTDPRKYIWLFEILQDGLPQCSGIGFGLERLTRYITGVKDIIDTVLFPKAPGYLGL